MDAEAVAVMDIERELRLSKLPLSLEAAKEICRLRSALAAAVRARDSLTERCLEQSRTISRLSSQPIEPGHWVRCGLRLPEPGSPVAVCDPYGAFVGSGREVAGRGWSWQVLHRASEGEWTVEMSDADSTYWVPLPDSPVRAK